MKYRKIIAVIMVFVFMTSTIKFAESVSASSLDTSYTTVTREKLVYDINTCEFNGDNFVIKGWCALGDYLQNMKSNSTHSYSLEMHNKTTGEYTYYSMVGGLQDVDKSDLLTTMGVEYPTYKNIGFIFNVPLSNLDDGCDYTFNLRVNLKTVGKKYKTKLYVFDSDETYEYDGYKYTAISDVTSKVEVDSNYLRGRTGAGTTSKYESINKWHYSAPNDYERAVYFLNGASFTVHDTAQVGSGISAETWIKIRYDYRDAGDRYRFVEGTTGYAWVTYSALLATGTQLTLTVDMLEPNTEINSVTTYTVKNGEKSNIIVNLTNEEKRSTNIKIYNGTTLLYNKNHTFSGTKNISTNFIVNTVAESGLALAVAGDLADLDTTMVTTYLDITQQEPEDESIDYAITIVLFLGIVLVGKRKFSMNK